MSSNMTIKLPGKPALWRKLSLTGHIMPRNRDHKTVRKGMIFETFTAVYN